MTRVLWCLCANVHVACKLVRFVYNLFFSVLIIVNIKRYCYYYLLICFPACTFICAHIFFYQLIYVFYTPGAQSRGTLDEEGCHDYTTRLATNWLRLRQHLNALRVAN